MNHWTIRLNLLLQYDTGLLQVNVMHIVTILPLTYNPPDMTKGAKLPAKC